ncbi:hypothetical protein Tco_0878494 [Tanacetum coccineum]|uniref:Reverse transcriptase domain-containing protein n=1 Tax=Tanacetum coccineum TaxID=301880 RepID=A0ABQ5C1G2_9ASTR
MPNNLVSKSKVRQSRSKAIVSKVSTSSSTPAVSSDVAELKDMVRALILDKKNQTPAPASVKAVEQSCVTCGDNDTVMAKYAKSNGKHNGMITKFVNSNTASTSGSGSLPSNTIANPKGDVKAITTRSGRFITGTSILLLLLEMEIEPEETKDLNQTLPFPARSLNQRKVPVKKDVFVALQKFMEICFVESPFRALSSR